MTELGRGRLLWFLFGLFFIWLAVVLAGYYVVQNAYLGPVYAALRGGIRWLAPQLSPAAVLRGVLDVLTATAIVLGWLGAGRWILDRLRPAGVSPLERLVFGAGLGAGGVALLVLLLGLVGLLQRPLLVGLVVLLAMVTLPSNIRFLRSLARPRPGTMIGLLLFGTALLALSLALLPPTSWDGLFYHLTGPKLYLQQSAIRPGPDIPHLNFPSLMEMNFLLAMGVRGDTTAVLLHFVFGLLLTGLVYAMAREVLQVKNSWLAVLMLLSMPMVYSLAAWGYSDLALALFQVGALHALLKWQANRPDGDPDRALEARGRPWLKGQGWLLLAAILCGLAMGVKYTSFVAPLTLLALLLWSYRGRLKQAAWPALVMLSLAALVASPWYVKNLVFTGNPAYPFIFGGRDWDSFRAAAYAEAGTGIGYDPGDCPPGAADHLVGQHAEGCRLDLPLLARRLVTLPFDLTLGLRDASRDGDPGPLFLLFLPLLLIYGLRRAGSNRSDGRQPGAFKATLFFAVAQYAFWTLGVVASASLWQSRLLLPALVALCPAVAWLLEDLARFDRPRFSLQRLLFLVIGLALLLGLAIRFAGWLPQQPWTYLIGNESLEANLGRRLGWHYQAMEAINALPEDAVVAFLWEPRSYYCERDCRPDSILDKFGHLTYLYGDAEGIARTWRDKGVSHVLIFESGLKLILAANSTGDEALPEPAALTGLRRNHLQLVQSVGDDVYQLFSLRPPN